jgi:hypothetical protein
VCLSRRRASGRRRRVEFAHDPQTLQDVLPAPERTVELLGVEDALADMPENQRRAILLREWQGLSYREIADELELSQAAVETLIFRARRTLAARLEGAEPAPRRRLARAFDASSALAALKTFLGGAAAKLAATAAALVVGGAAVGILVSPAPPPQRPFVGDGAEVGKPFFVEPAVPRSANLDREPRVPKEGTPGTPDPAAVSKTASAPAPVSELVETSVVEETSTALLEDSAALLEESAAVVEKTASSLLEESTAALEDTTALLEGTAGAEGLLDLEPATVLP